MNLYAHLNTFKSPRGITSTAKDEEILRILGAVSREIDDRCKRHFYAVSAARFFGPGAAGYCRVDDLLGVSEVATDPAGDASYSQVWTEFDYRLEPANRYPKTELRTMPHGTKCFVGLDRYVRVTGIFGYGDGYSASPWRTTSLTGTVANATGTTLTLSGSGGVYAGMTLLQDAEQLYVSAVSGTSATVVRGVNGTTAEAHAGAAVKVAVYPAQVEGAVLQLASSLFSLVGREAVRDITIGEYRETLVSDARLRDQLDDMLGTLVRPLYG